MSLRATAARAATRHCTTAARAASTPLQPRAAMSLPPRRHCATATLPPRGPGHHPHRCRSGPGVAGRGRRGAPDVVGKCSGGHASISPSAGARARQQREARLPTDPAASDRLPGHHARICSPPAGRATSAHAPSCQRRGRIGPRRRLHHRRAGARWPAQAAARERGQGKEPAPGTVRCRPSRADGRRGGWACFPTHKVRKAFSFGFSFSSRTCDRTKVRTCLTELRLL